MNRKLLLAVIVYLFATSVVADDSDVYESMTNVKIGRVFLSQAERDSLDARRLLQPKDADGVSTTSTDSTPEDKPLASAGYFKSSNGPSQVWKDGDFVNSNGDAVRAVTFPGDVKITRHSTDTENDGDHD